MKKCSRCKVVKPLSEFWKYRQSKDGYNWWCKLCYRPKAASPLVNASRGRVSLPPNPYFDNAFVHNLLQNIRKSAIARHRAFDLDANFLRERLVEFCSTNYFQTTPRAPFRPSADRIDNSKGYTKDNVRICWLIENYCKNVFPESAVIEFCKRKLGLPLP